MFRLINFLTFYLFIAWPTMAQCYTRIGVDFTSPYNQTFNNKLNIAFPNVITKDGAALSEFNKVSKEHGREKYFKGALNGIYPLEFQGIHEKVNVLDLALMRKAEVSADIIERLKALGLKPSVFYWRPMFSSPATDRKTLFTEYISWGNNVNELLISDLNIGNYAIRKGDVELLTQFINHGGDLYEGFLTDTTSLDIEQRLAFASLVDFGYYNKQYQQQQQEKQQVDQIPINNPDFMFLDICENLDDWAMNNIKGDWTIQLDEIEQIISKAKHDCPKTVLDCIQRANPIVAEVYMRREHGKKLSNKKVKTIKTIEEFHQLKRNQIGSFRHSNNSNGGFFYEKLLRDRALHENLIENAKALTLYRLNKVGEIIADNHELTEYLFKTLPKIKEEVYLGKNLAYYVSLHSDNKNYLKWFYQRYGEVDSQYGISHYMYSIIRAIHYSKFNGRSNMYKKLGYQTSDFDDSFIQKLFH